MILREKIIYADNGLDFNWLLMMLDDVAEVTNEKYYEPRFKLIQTLFTKASNSDLACARRKAEAKSKEWGLRTHRADNDV